MRYVLDEDVNPAAATAAHGLGLDVTSVHELGRRGLSDEEQLAFALAEGRVLITRNRNDFLRLARAEFAAGRDCPGILIIPASVPNRDGSRTAHALKRWHDRHQHLPPVGFVDVLH